MDPGQVSENNWLCLPPRPSWRVEVPFAEWWGERQQVAWGPGMGSSVSAGERPMTTITSSMFAEFVGEIDRPQDIEDEDAMSFFGGDEGDADLSQG